MIPLTPWIERKFIFDFPLSHFAIIYSRLQGSIYRVNELVKFANEESSTFNTNGWSVKEHIGHLYDLEELWWKRLHDFKNGKHMLAAADMTNKKTKLADHNASSLDQLVKLFSTERRKILDQIFEYDEADLSLTSLHPRLQQPMRLVDSLYFVAEHDDHHLAAITLLLNNGKI